MRLEGILKKIIIDSYLITGLAFNPLYAKADNIENYFQQKITEAEKKDDKKEALKNQYLLNKIINSKKEFNRRFYAPPIEKKPSWDKTEKILAYSYLTLNAIDCYQTIYGLNKEKIIEKNPFATYFIGKKPNPEELLLFKIATTAGELWLFDKIPTFIDKYIDSHKSRKFLLASYNLFYIANIINNKKNIGVVFKF